MRFNDREIIDASSVTPTYEGRLNYRPPSGNFGQSGFKERWFRLRCNMLFYFRINESGKVDPKPSGVFVLENSSIQPEQSSSIPFAFSIIFKDEPEKKHIFSGRSDANVQMWINSVKHCTYEYLRTQRILLQKQITLKTGKDPLLMYPYNEGTIRSYEPIPEKSDNSNSSVKLSPAKVIPESINRSRTPPIPRKASFQCHLTPEVPLRSAAKGISSSSNINKVSVTEQMSFQSNVKPLVPQRTAPTLPLPKSEVQSAGVISPSEINLIEF